MKILIALSLILSILLVYFYCTRTTRVIIQGEKYNVVASYKDREQAAQLLATVNGNLINFMRYLREKYKQHHNADVREIVRSIITNYSPETIVENDPRFSMDTSYTVDKGRKILLCLRDKHAPYTVVDYNTMMFVVLHEVGGHIGNYNGWQHTTRFWTIFKFVLYEAANFGIYAPVDYERSPVVYCGMTIDYQPLNDKTLPDMWKY